MLEGADAPRVINGLQIEIPQSYFGVALYRSIKIRRLYNTVFGRFSKAREIGARLAVEWAKRVPVSYYDDFPPFPVRKVFALPDCCEYLLIVAVS